MKNIYVVTQGEYSDYGIVTMFTDIENARRFVELQDDRWSEHRIETWEIDVCVDDVAKIPQGKFKWKVYMDREGCTDVYDIKKAYDEEVSIQFQELLKDPMHMVVVLVAKDEKTAVKICNEKRVQLIASGEWDQALKEYHEYREGKLYGRIFEKKIL